MEKLAILDCGGQYTKVIDRKIREAGVYTDIFPMGVCADKLTGYGAIIFSGGPSSVWESGAPTYDEKVFDLPVPMLGICYGMQLMVEHFGGEVAPEVKTEYGQIDIEIDPACPLFKGLSKHEKVLMSHGDAVKTMPDGFTLVAKTGDVCAGVWNAEKRLAGVQFHPEVDPTVHGIAMLNNFVRDICRFTEEYALEDRIATSVDMIRRRVGDGKVVVLVSGGVDSAVTAALLVKALKPEQVYGIHIDHGLMRKDESDLICENLADLGLTQMQRINAEDDFFHTPLTIDGKSYPPLAETCDPEEKRAIIGHMFFVVTEKAAEALSLDFNTAFLAQGTLRPDLIESGNPDVSGYAHKIKTHHNDVGIIRTLRNAGHVIETNWDWHKDEVRRVARMLGLDEAIASRQPFPGPGLGVRLICCEGAEPTQPKEKIDAIVSHLAKESDGAYTVALGPIRSVGVQGDNRSYKTLSTLYPAHPKTPLADIDWQKVMQVAKTIPNNFNFVNRVAFCLNGAPAPSPYGTDTKCTGMHVCRETADLLREIDAIVTDTIMNKNIAQCFAVLFPMSLDDTKHYSCAIRAVCTTDYMTARSAVPGEDFTLDALNACVSRITATVGNQISHVFYDVTGKPPATIEWE